MIKILIADDHTIVRKGIIQILTAEFTNAQIEEASSAEELIERAVSKNWDIVITDISMPGRSGLDALQQIKLSKPHLPVLVLSMYPEEQYAVRVLKAGASGYLNKEVAPVQLIHAIQQILSGRKYISPAVAETMTNYLFKEQRKQAHEYLSNREFEVMKLLAAGKSIGEIATVLKLSVSSISTYRSRIFSKMEVTNTAALTVYVIDHKLDDRM
ncbi:response regulator transcription factor [Segetibacter sp. 3557_3]|uniref:response regulator n=1 Tax=Segetibacter sp. 3557_3 TaxID=2547429 RepID=UPI001058641D|nr:response regulator transcription factor [Segetibacter sp. 3557_3]TDH28552.1 response regulator transcription factor [Segetibacter sp. 3557_3]